MSVHLCLSDRWLRGLTPARANAVTGSPSLRLPIQHCLRRWGKLNPSPPPGFTESREGNPLHPNPVSLSHSPFPLATPPAVAASGIHPSTSARHTYGRPPLPSGARRALAAQRKAATAPPATKGSPTGVLCSLPLKVFLPLTPSFPLPFVT